MIQPPRLKSWFLKLSVREQYLVAVSVIAVLLLLVYLWVWVPLQNAKIAQRQRAVAQRQLLAWVKHANQTVRRLRATGLGATLKSQSAILVVVERTLAGRKLNIYLNQVQQLTAKNLKLEFNAVPFDALMEWLQMLWRQHAVSVVQITVVKTKTLGLVKVNLELKQNE